MEVNRKLIPFTYHFLFKVMKTLRFPDIYEVSIKEKTCCIRAAPVPFQIKYAIKFPKSFLSLLSLLQKCKGTIIILYTDLAINVTLQYLCFSNEISITLPFSSCTFIIVVTFLIKFSYST